MNISHPDEILKKIDLAKIILTQQDISEGLKIEKLQKLGLDLEDIFDLAIGIDPDMGAD